MWQELVATFLFKLAVFFIEKLDEPTKVRWYGENGLRRDDIHSVIDARRVREVRKAPGRTDGPGGADAGEGGR